MEIEEEGAYEYIPLLSVILRHLIESEILFKRGKIGLTFISDWILNAVMT